MTGLKERQFFAGITQPLRTGFRRDLDPELKTALVELWAIGPRSRDLYLKIGKGLASLSRADLILLLASRTPEEIESLAGELASGGTLRALDP
jgi:hypothetical protein